MKEHHGKKLLFLSVLPVLFCFGIEKERNQQMRAFIKRLAEDHRCKPEESDDDKIRESKVLLDLAQLPHQCSLDFYLN